MTNLRSIPLSTFAVALLGSAALLSSAALITQTAMAQTASPSVRIVNRIDESQLVTLKGNTHPAANAQNDRGLVSSSLPMTDLILVLSRSPEQQAAFDAYVAGEYDQSSPNFHHWLTPDQVGTQYGPAAADIAAISNWLASHGLTVKEVTKDHMSIRFSGTAGQVQSAFHTEIHNLSVKGVAHIANMTDPQIPAALAPVIVGVKALHNFFPKPLHRLGSTVQRDASTGQWKRLTSAATAGSTASPINSGAKSLAAAKPSSAANPQFGISVGGSSPYLVEDVDPWDFATIYNILPLWNAAKPIDGTGQTIAIAGTSDINVGQTGEPGADGFNDVLTFRQDFGLPTSNAANTPIRVSGNSQPLTVCTDLTGTLPCGIGDLTENSLDVEWAGAIAKNAQVVLVSSYPASASDDNLYDSESYIVNNINTASSPVYGARIMNVSYGECELSLGAAGNVQYYNLWQQAAAEGIAVFVAAGDSGSDSCDQGNTVSPIAESGVSVSGLASTPWNTAVGGTDFNWCSPDKANGTAANTECTPSPYWSSTPLTSPGSTAAVTSALGYVPETPWNETCANSLTLSWVQDIANYLYGIPSSGSNGVTNTEQACNFLLDYDFTTYGNTAGLGYYYPYITYLLQAVGGSGGASGCVVGTAITNNTTGGISGCSTGATSTGATTNPDPPYNAQGSLTLVNNGWPKPSWQTGVFGIPTDGVRDLPDVSFFASDGFVSSSAYLICVSAPQTTGGVATPCTYSTYSEPFYQEVGGTSVATPAMAGIMAMVNQKTGAAQGFANAELYKLAASQSYGGCSAESVIAGSATCMFNDIDQGNNAAPCDEGVFVSSIVSPNCTATSSTLGVADSNGGLGILTGYSAGTSYDLATGLGSLNVANVVNAWTAVTGTATAKVTVAPGATALNSNNTLSVTGTVASTATGGTTPTGTVTLTASGTTYSASAALSGSGSYSFTIPANSLPGSTTGLADTLTVAYGGDIVYAAASGTATVTVTTVAQLTPTVTVTPATTTLNSNVSLGVTGTVAGPSGASIIPTGTVTLSVGSYTSAAQTLVNGAYSFTNSSAIPANTLSAGSNTITVTYSGNSGNGNYGSASGTAVVTATSSTFSLTSTPITLSPSTASTTGIAPGASATATVTVTAQAGYTGTVTLTCSEQSSTATGGDGITSCTVSPSQVVLTSSTTSGTVTFTVNTAAQVGELVYPKVRGEGGGWMGAGSGAVLALLVFLGIPSRRSWRQMLGVLVVMMALGSMIGCGSGGSTGSSGVTDTGTTAGTYTLKVTASATSNTTPTVTTSGSTTFAVVVN